MKVACAGSILAVDQGTTSTKSYVLDADGGLQKQMQIAHRQIFPRLGWVEHDPIELLNNVQACFKASHGTSTAGLANQGETIIAWDGRDGQPIYNDIVWQDNRTSEMINRMRSNGDDEITRDRAGLPLNTYFSACRWPACLKSGRPQGRSARQRTW